MPGNRPTRYCIRSRHSLDSVESCQRREDTCWRGLRWGSLSISCNCSNVGQVPGLPAKSGRSGTCPTVYKDKMWMFWMVAALSVCGATDDLTPKKPVTDDYGGIKVVDDYRWLESAADPDVRQWSSSQNARTRSYLDQLP